AVPLVKMTSTFMWTNSEARLRRRSSLPSANRYSMVMFFPSAHPSSRSPCRNASLVIFAESSEVELRNPMRRTFATCCASVVEQSAKNIAARASPMNFLFMSFSSSRSTCQSTLDTHPFSFNHLIRPRQHVGRNRQTDLLRCLEIDDELKLGRLLNGKVGGLGTFEDFIHIGCGPTSQVAEVHPVGHKSAGFHMFRPFAHDRETVFNSELRELS